MLKNRFLNAKKLISQVLPMAIMIFWEYNSNDKGHMFLNFFTFLEELDQEIGAGF